MWKPSAFGSLLFAVGLSAHAAGADEALLGCWRSQQVQVTLADQSHNDQNGDCVSEYDAEFVRSRCSGASGQTGTLSAWQRVGQDTLRVTPLDPSTRAAKGAPSELRYRIEDRWLMIERQLPAGVAGAKQPRILKSVSVRVRPDAGGSTANCTPRGESKLRVGRAPASSLALSLPAGWEPVLIDPYADERLRPAVNTSLFIGAFAPVGASVSQSKPARMVLVLDDVRYGAKPVQARDFGTVKQRFVAEMGAAKLTCDEPDKVCALLTEASGNQAYTELLNVNGRVAIITSTIVGAKGDSLSVLRDAAQTFASRLRLDNSN
ncbi:hypothetical protein HUX88_19250 [Duganella sp. BJB1802]|uniref:hypothetical protein n=1 Tax=Duganella sp. BJB1802 TaxID=2744575 RepID=UPI0015946461|nr:hypothetical protein [Duganella sp. BJB1802]NVD72660.1 hypothetical protein [Duganella sp. BJB1802]